MASENKYVNADFWDDTNDVYVNKKTNAAHNDGAKTVAMVQTFEVAVADDDGSIYRIFKNINPDLIPISITIYNDAITAATDYELGFYETLEDGQGGAVIDIDALMGTTDISGGNARSSPADGLSAVAIENVQKRLYELAGHTISTKKRGYDIAFTANTVGSAVGTISVVAQFVQG